MKKLTTAVSLLLALSFLPAMAIERKDIKKAIEQQIIHNQTMVDTFVSRAAQGFYNAVKMYIKQGVDINAKDSNGRTALIAVASAPVSSDNYLKLGHVATLLLSQKDIDVDVRENVTRMTALMHAAARGNSYIVSLLLKANAPADRQDYFGNTPLLYAAMSGKVSTAKKILQAYPMAIDLPNYAGKTPLIVAAQNGHKGVVQLILQECKEHVCDINSKDKSGRTARMIAEEAGYNEIVSMIDNANALASK